MLDAAKTDALAHCTGFPRESSIDTCEGFGKLIARRTVAVKRTAHKDDTFFLFIRFVCSRCSALREEQTGHTVMVIFGLIMTAHLGLRLPSKHGASHSKLLLATSSRLAMPRWGSPSPCPGPWSFTGARCFGPPSRRQRGSEWWWLRGPGGNFESVAQSRGRRGQTCSSCRRRGSCSFASGRTGA